MASRRTSPHLCRGARRGKTHPRQERQTDSGDEEVLFEHGPNATSHHHLGGWSADGRVLIFTMFGDVHVLKASGTVTTESDNSDAIKRTRSVVVHGRPTARVYVR